MGIDYLCTHSLFKKALNEYNDKGDSLQDYADHYLHMAEKLKLCKLGLSSDHHFYVKELNQGTTITDLREGYLWYTFRLFNNILLDFIDHNYLKAIYYSLLTKIIYPIANNECNYDYSKDAFRFYHDINITIMANRECYHRLSLVPYFMSSDKIEELNIYLVYIQLDKNKGLYLVDDSNLTDLNINFDKDVEQVIDEFSFYKGITLHKLFEYDNQKDKLILS